MKKKKALGNRFQITRTRQKERRILSWRLILILHRSGVGRRTAVSIVAALHQAKLVAMKMGKNFGPKQFKSELKAAMQTAAVEDGQIFLLLEDHNFNDPQFLDMVSIG